MKNMKNIHLGSYLLTGLISAAIKQGANFDSVKTPQQRLAISLQTMFPEEKVQAISIPQNDAIIAEEVETVRSLTHIDFDEEENTDSFYYDKEKGLAKGLNTSLTDYQYDQIKQYAKDAEFLIYENQLQALGISQLSATEISVRLTQIIADKFSINVSGRFYYLKARNGNFLIATNDYFKYAFQKILPLKKLVNPREFYATIAATCDEEKISSISGVNQEMLQNSLENLDIPFAISEEEKQLFLHLTDENSKKHFNIYSDYFFELKPAYIQFLKVKDSKYDKPAEMVGAYLKNNHFKLLEQENPLVLISSQKNIAKLKKDFNDYIFQINPRSQEMALLYTLAKIDDSKITETQFIIRAIKNIIGVEPPLTFQNGIYEATIPFYKKLDFQKTFFVNLKENNCFNLDAELAKDIIYKSKLGENASLTDAIIKVIGNKYFAFYDKGSKITLANPDDWIVLQSCRRQIIELTTPVKLAIKLAAQQHAMKFGKGPIPEYFKDCCDQLKIDLQAISERSGLSYVTKKIIIDKENLDKLNQIVSQYVQIKPDLSKYLSIHKDSKYHSLDHLEEEKIIIAGREQLKEVHLNSIPDIYKTCSGQVITEPYLTSSGQIYNQEELKQLKNEIPYYCLRLKECYEFWQKDNNFKPLNFTDIVLPAFTQPVQPAPNKVPSLSSNTNTLLSNHSNSSSHSGSHSNSSSHSTFSHSLRS